MAGELQVHGLANLTRTLRRAGVELGDLKQANAQAGQVVAQWAGVRAPHRTGRLGASVRAGRRVGGARVTSSLVYAGPIHYGWPGHGIAANPFIERAAAETQPAWLAVYERDLARICAAVKGL